MADRFKGITIEIDGNTKKLESALSKANKETRALDKQLRAVDKALKFNPTSVKLWSEKQKLLTDEIDKTNQKLKALKQAQEKMDAEEVDKNSEEYRALQREIAITETDLKKLETELRKIGNVKLRALGEQFKQVGQKMMDAGRTLTTKVTAPLAALGGVALKAGADFDTAMSQVAATMGTTVDEIKDLRDFAIKMGSMTAFSATQAAEGLNYMALAGYSAEESMEMLPTVLSLAAAGSMELATASDMVTDAQSALGLSTEETVEMVDQMAATASTTNTSVSQLGEAMLTVGGTAKMMKGGTAELSQVLGLLADNGIKGSEGGTALRNILLSLSAPTSKAAAEMDKLGLNVFNANGDMRSMEDIMKDLNGALDGMTSEERTKAISTIFNKRDLKAVNALLGTQAERWEEVGEAISGSEGAAEQMAETQLDNLAGSLTLLKSALEGAGIAISDVLAPYVKRLAEWVTGLVDKFNNLSPQAQKIITLIGVAVAAIGPLLLIGGAITKGVGSIIITVGKLGGLVTKVIGFIGALSPVMIAVVAGIAALIAIGILLYKNWDTIKAKAIAFKDKLVKTFNDIKTKITSTWTAIKTSVANTVTSMISSVKAKIDAFKTSIKTKFDAIKTAITNPIKTAKETLDKIIGKITGLFPINLAGVKIFSGLKLPHFKISGGEAPWGIGGKGVKPTVDVQWYKTGGIFDSPSVIGVGEAGKEAVIPLDKLWDKMDNIAAASGNIVINVYGSDNMSVNELAAAVEARIIQLQKRRTMAWQ